MDLEFSNPKFYQLEEAFNDLLPDSLTMSQYDLAENTEFSAKDWSEFLKDGQVSKWIESEVALVTKANQYKLISAAADNERSVGAAQMLNAITKMETGDKAEANYFIYSFVPMTNAEAHSEFTRIEPEWQPPLEIDDPAIEQDKKTQELLANTDDKEDVPEKLDATEKEVTKDDWF